jgi:hypothetical protein
LILAAEGYTGDYAQDGGKGGRQDESIGRRVEGENAGASTGEKRKRYESGGNAHDRAVLQDRARSERTLEDRGKPVVCGG